MAFELQWEVEGVTELSRRLNFLDGELKDFTPAFRKSATSLKRFVAGEVFDSEGAVYGNKWAPLNPAYEAFKKSKYPGKGILERTGKMRKSFKTQHGRDFAVVFNSVDYFNYHQSRLSRSTNLPRRVMLKLDGPRKEMVVKIFQAEFFKKTKKA